MGQLRVNTIAKLIAAPVEHADLVLEDYASIKTAKLLLKVPSTNRDVFEEVCMRKKEIVSQAQAAREFTLPKWKAQIVDQTPLGVARASEEIAQVYDCSIGLRNASNDVERVQVYRNLLPLLVTTKFPFVKNSLIDTFLTLHREIPSNMRQALFTKPLAVAIGLTLSGFLPEPLHREAVQKFLDIHFCGDLKPVGKEVAKELGRFRRQQTSQLLHLCRVTDRLG